MGHGLIELCAIGQWDFGLNLAGGRVVDIGKTSRGAFDMGAIDIVG